MAGFPAGPGQDEGRQRGDRRTGIEGHHWTRGADHPSKKRLAAATLWGMATPKLRNPAAPSPPKMTRTELDAFVQARQDLDERRKELGRQAAQLGREISKSDAQLKTIIDAEAKGPDRTLNLKKWRLSILQVAKSVSWKTEFTQLAGEERVAELEAAAGTRDQLSIEAR